MVEIYFDGGTALNSTCVFDGKSGFVDIKEYTGKFTNNQLEYMALYDAIVYADVVYPGLGDVCFVGDSQLVIKQMQGEFAVRQLHLQKLYAMISNEILQRARSPHNRYLFKWVRREFNRAGVALEMRKKLMDMGAATGDNGGEELKV